MPIPSNIPNIEQSAADVSPFTVDEQICMNDLGAAWNTFSQLPNVPLTDVVEFKRHINNLQKILIYRAASRRFPDYFTQID